MNSNKSIDGLTTRRAKKSATSSPSTPKTTSQKSVNSARRVATKPATKRTVRTTTTRATRPTTTKPTTTTTTRPTATKPTTTTRTAKPKPTTARAPKPTRTPKAPITKRPKPVPMVDILEEPKALDTAALQSETPIDTHQTPSTTEAETTKSPDTPRASAEDFLTPTQTFNFDDQTGELQASDTPINSHPDKTNEADQENEDGDDEPALPKHKQKKVKKPVSKKRKIITSIILAIVLLLIAGVIWIVIWGNDIIAKITGGQGNIFDLLTFVEPTYEPLKTDANGRTNLLAFGTSGYNMEGDEGNGVHDGAQLTDSIMAISLNQETGDIAMVSLPRDLKASPTCTATGKINEVYWCNNMDGSNEQAGAEALMKEVGDILGIDFQYYAHLNWGSLVQIVDQLGGITVTLDEDIEDYYYTGAVFEAGKEYTIDGGQALGLARARHGTTGGDFSRGASQQKILIGIKNKIQEKELSLTDLISLANTLGDNLRTNFNVEELKTIAHLASDLDLESMRQISLLEPEPLMTTGTINGISYVLPSGGAGYYNRIQKYVAKMLSNNPSVYEDATILVLNGTETPGLAGSEQKALEDEGYEGITIDDAPAGEYTDKYALYVIADAKPGTKKALETKYGLEAKPATELPAGIPTNYDFVLILGGENHE